MGREKRPSADCERGKMPGRRSRSTNGKSRRLAWRMTDRTDRGRGRVGVQGFDPDRGSDGSWW